MSPTNRPKKFIREGVGHYQPKKDKVISTKIKLEGEGRVVVTLVGFDAGI